MELDLVKMNKLTQYDQDLIWDILEMPDEDLVWIDLDGWALG